MTLEQRDMLIRHDEQLKALCDLPDAVNKLTTALEVSNARITTAAVFTGVLGSIISAAGTWIVMYLVK